MAASKLSDNERALYELVKKGNFPKSLKQDRISKITRFFCS